MGKAGFGKGWLWKRLALEKAGFGKGWLWKRLALEKACFGEGLLWKMFALEEAFVHSSFKPKLPVEFIRKITSLRVIPTVTSY